MSLMNVALASIRSPLAESFVSRIAQLRAYSAGSHNGVPVEVGHPIMTSWCTLVISRRFYNVG